MNQVGSFHLPELENAIRAPENNFLQYADAYKSQGILPFLLQYFEVRFKILIKNCPSLISLALASLPHKLEYFLNLQIFLFS